MVASVECCDEMVKDELLRDLLPAVEVRSWLCLRARGTGGGTLFCGGASGVGPDSLDLCCVGAGRCWETSCELMCVGGAKLTGVGGSGLFTSELSRGCVTGEGAGSDAAKLSNDTVCGCLGMTSFPCRCFGAGGGFFFPFLTSDTSPMLSSSSDSGISYDVLGDSMCVSCGDSKVDCREMDEVSVLLLSNWRPPNALGGAAL